MALAAPAKATEGRSRLPRGSLLLFWALSVGSGSAYLFHLLMTRLLGPPEYGALGAILAIVMVLMVATSGLQAIVARRIAAPGATVRAVLRPAVRLSVLVGAAVAVGIAITAPWLAAYLRFSSPLPLLLLAVFVVPAFLVPVGRGGLQGVLRFSPLAWGIAGHAVSRLALGTLLVVAGFGIAGAVLSLVVAEIAAAVFAFAPLRRELGASDAPDVTGLPREAAAAAGALLGLWLVASVDVILVRHYLEAEAAGQYAAAALVGRGLLAAASAMAVVVFPLFATEGEDGRGLLPRTAGMAAGLGLLVSGAIAFFPGLLTLALGADYGPAGRLAPLLGLAGTVFGIAALLIYRKIAIGSGGGFLLWAGAALEAMAIARFHGSAGMVAALAVGSAVLVTAILWLGSVRRPRSVRIPDGELWEAVPGRVDLSVITPTYNGEATLAGNLEELITALREAGIEYEVIVVSDGSTDGTVRAARAYETDRVRLLHYENNQGKGHALRTGLARATGRYVAFIDSDGDLDSGDLVRFLTLMSLHRADMVVGSKRHPLSEISYPATRRVLSWIYHRLVRILLGIRVRDTQTGIKLMRRDMLAEVLPRLVEKRFAFDLELMVAARRAGYRRILEAPIKLRYRFTSTISRRAMVGMALDTLAICYRRYLVRQYDPVDTAPSIEMLQAQAEPALRT